MVPLSSLALPRFLHSALVAAGYNSLDDLDGVHPNELARDLKITLEAASDVLRQADYRRGECSPSPTLVQLRTDKGKRDHPR